MNCPIHPDIILTNHNTTYTCPNINCPIRGATKHTIELLQNQENQKLAQKLDTKTIIKEICKRPLEERKQALHQIAQTLD